MHRTLKRKNDKTGTKPKKKIHKNWDIKKMAMTYTFVGTIYHETLYFFPECIQNIVNFVNFVIFEKKPW